MIDYKLQMFGFCLVVDCLEIVLALVLHVAKMDDEARLAVGL